MMPRSPSSRPVSQVRVSPRTPGTSRPTSQVVDNIADLLSCSVCMELFNEGDRRPKLLACHHSFCYLCLERITKNKTSLECPTCRIVHELPKDGIESLQTNFYVTHMKELLGEQSWLKEKGCRKHGNAELTYFCRTCEIAICAECVNADHKESLGHDTVAISIAAQEKTKLLQISMGEAKETVISNKKILTNLETEASALFAAKNKAATDIDVTFEKYIEALRVRRLQLHNQLSKMYTSKQEQLMNRVEELRRNETSLLALVEQCDEAIKRGVIADILAYSAKLTAKNADVRNHDVPSVGGNDFIKFDAEDGQTEFRQSVQELGGFVSKKALPSVVRFTSQHTTAALFTTLSFTVQSASYEDLHNYPIRVNITDSFDDSVPCLVQPRSNGRYEFTFRPQVSGVHRVQVTFLDTAILAEYTLNVQSNNPVMKVGSQGMGDHEMEYPRAVAIDNKNNTYVVDTGNCRIQKYDKTGQFVLGFPIDPKNQNISSCGIAVDPVRNVLICPEVSVCEADLAHANAILMYNMEGQPMHVIKCRDVMKRALSVAVNSSGNIIIADYELDSIFIFDKHGRPVKKFGGTGDKTGQFNHPTFVCIGDSDNIIVSDGDNHRIQVFDKNGHFLYQFGKRGTGKGQFNIPFGVAADQHGNILVVDGGNRRIQIFKHNGDFVGCIESMGDRMNAPRGIAVTSDGYVVVADRDNHCFKKYKYLLCTSL